MVSPRWCYLMYALPRVGGSVELAKVGLEHNGSKGEQVCQAQWA
jgi:hypothetical protein